MGTSIKCFQSAYISAVILELSVLPITEKWSSFVFIVADDVPADAGPFHHYDGHSHGEKYPFSLVHLITSKPVET